MPRGRRCRSLTPHQILRLEKIRKVGDQDHRSGFTYPELKLSMSGEFKLDTLLRAMAGKPIWERYHAFIVEWLDRYFPEPLPRDGKAAASGERPEEGDEAPEGREGKQAGSRQGALPAQDDERDEKEAKTTGTLRRGSR